MREELNQKSEGGEGKDKATKKKKRILKGTKSTAGEPANLKKQIVQKDRPRGTELLQRGKRLSKNVAKNVSPSSQGNGRGRSTQLTPKGGLRDTKTRGRVAKAPKKTMPNMQKEKMCGLLNWGKAY